MRPVQNEKLSSPSTQPRYIFKPFRPHSATKSSDSAPKICVKLAHAITNGLLKPLHSDRAVAWSGGPVFHFVSDAIAAGYDRRTIAIAYETALQRRHVLAKELQPLHGSTFQFSVASTVTEARRELATFEPDFDGQPKRLIPSLKKPTRKRTNRKLPGAIRERLEQLARDPRVTIDQELLSIAAETGQEVRALMGAYREISADRRTKKTSPSWCGTFTAIREPQAESSPLWPEAFETEFYELLHEFGDAYETDRSSACVARYANRIHFLGIRHRLSNFQQTQARKTLDEILSTTKPTLSSKSTN